MSLMDHAAAHERIADLTLEPHRLAGLESSAEAEDVALREHVRSCPRCQAEIEEWRTFHRAMAAVVATDRREQLEPIQPPADLRRRVLAAAGVSVGAGRRPREHGRARPTLSGRALVALAAVIALIAVGAGVMAVRDQSARLERAALEHRWLSDTVTGLTRILADPDRKLVTLRTASGADGGSITWSKHDLVVLAHALTEPPAGQVYRCWLAFEDTETAVGLMWFVDGKAFWAGSTQDWATVDMHPDRQFLVTLEAADAPETRHSGPIVLQAALGG